MPACVDARWLIATLAPYVRDFVVAAGSRSAPLAYAIASAEGSGMVCAYPAFDERSAGFYALGLAQASKAPVAVVTTSGTAPAHLLPAVIEAFHTGAPLIVISADRPFEMRGVGASQTTDQSGLFGNHVVAQLDVPADVGISPDALAVSEDGVARAFVARVRRLVGQAVGVRGAGGPAHINIGFRDPLTPEGAPAVADLDAGIPARLARRQPAVTAWEDAVHDLRTVIVAGDKAEGTAQLAQAAGVPLLAEPSSGAFGAPAFCGFQQQMLTRFAGEVEQVVVLGHPSLSRPVSRLLAGPARVVVASNAREYPDVAGSADLVVEQLAPARQKMSQGAWTRSWAEHAQNIGRWIQARELSQLAVSSLHEGNSQGDNPRATDANSGTHHRVPHGVIAARAVWDAYANASRADGPADVSHALVLGASNSIRYIDLAADSPVGNCAKGVFAARGQAGIDGTIATAKGIAMGLDCPVRVLLGDLTFMHDIGSLLLPAGQSVPDVDVVVIDDQGGRIFQSLEHGLAPSALYERFFAVAHSLDFEALAAATGWEYVRADFTSATRNGKNGVEADAFETLTRALADRPRGRIIHVVADHSEVRAGVQSLFPEKTQVY
ncbi:thiamine pyrophosphate-binding protein [Actinomyces urinae]|uniref:thiamine pyrophosphate-binding protein n=1 Tax=Actinomyces urinae TaxID=1689268 RepID=UPI0009306E8B|nr:thiamine pyrophosphate-binding protein [Actinomyces urinae]